MYVDAFQLVLPLNRRYLSQTQEVREQFSMEQRRHIEAGRIGYIEFPLPRIASSYLNLY